MTHKILSPGTLVRRAGMSTCPECGSTDLQWQPYVMPPKFQASLYAVNEMSVGAYLFCNECSETLTVVDADEVTKMLNTTRIEKTT